MKSRGFTPTRTWRRKHWVALLAGQDRPVLAVGATGRAVSRLQRALTAARQRVAVTGSFDEATRTALLAYQARVKAAPTGHDRRTHVAEAGQGPLLSRPARAAAEVRRAGRRAARGR